MEEIHFSADPTVEQHKNLIPKQVKVYLLHALLFLATFFTTTLAGIQWLNKDPFDLGNFSAGLPYSLCILAVLTAHEFGHYFAARYYNIEATLPYFIPIPPFLFNPFGTMGAVIRIRGMWTSRKALFDVGIAGPIAGFIVTLAILLYGFFTLPGKEYIYSIHPNYIGLQNLPENGLTFGNSLFFWGLRQCFAPNNFMPQMNEIYHYPFLCVGWFGLFVTALNLIPVGQLDGGHILYSLVGTKRQGVFARIFFFALIIVGLASFIPIRFLHFQIGTTGWLLWALILYFFVKLDHPDIADPEPLPFSRKILGWMAIVIFILTFPPIPFFD